MFRIEIETDNAAFADDPVPEIARLLRYAADKIESQGLYTFALYDINGNRCGVASRVPWSYDESD